MSEERLTRNYTWEPLAALACFIGAALSLVIGFVLTTAWVVNAERHPYLHAMGLTLLIIGLPILILGAHCLDLNDRKTKTTNAELHRQRNESRKSLHVVVVLLATVFAVCVAPQRLNAQQAGTVEPGETSNTESQITSKDASISSR